MSFGSRHRQLRASSEADFSATIPTRTYNFNTDFQGWSTSGTFNRVDGGGGNFFLASSSCLDDQCDVAQSPIMKLTNTSTLSLQQRYDTETPSPIPYDRANVGVRTLDNLVRTAVVPSGCGEITSRCEVVGSGVAARRSSPPVVSTIARTAAAATAAAPTTRRLTRSCGRGLPPPPSRNR